MDQYENYQKYIFSFMLILTLFKCTDNSNLDPIDELALCQIDFQSGFEGHYVDLRINEKIYFIGRLSEEVPFSGPIARLTTYIPRGNNELAMRWLNTVRFVYDSCEINIGDSEQYFIGINLIENVIDVQIQDTEFIYL